MIQADDVVTFSVSRAVLCDIVALSMELTTHMHELLERNADGQLCPNERRELEAIARVVEFGQIVSMALQPRGLR